MEMFAEMWSCFPVRLAPKSSLVGGSSLDVPIARLSFTGQLTQNTATSRAGQVQAADLQSRGLARLAQP